MTTLVVESKDIETSMSGLPTDLQKEIITFVKKTCKKNKTLVIYTMNGEAEIFERGVGLSFVEVGDSSLEESMEIPEDAYLLPLLFAVDKKGKERVWKIWVIGNTVYKSYGEVGGEKIPSSRTYKAMNVGRSNETTAEEQAKREAERDWVKQLDKEYSPKPGKGDDIAKRILDAKKKQGNVNVNISALIRGIPESKKDTKVSQKSKEKKAAADTDDNGTLPDFQYTILPMHCQTWSNQPKVLKYFDFDNGVYIQPKLDGIRCLVQLVKDDQGNTHTVMLSRKGKQFVWLKHLRQEAQTFLKGYQDVVLDCEVYAEVIHGKMVGSGKKKNYAYSEGDPELLIEQRFDVISGAVRPVRKSPHPLEDQLCLHVFDIADPTGKMDQDDRFELMKKLFARKDISKVCPHIRRVETKVIEYPEEIEDYHDEVAGLGYEGVVIRARDLLYESDGRSLRMRKHKMFAEKEFPIVDVECDEGVDREQFTWVCEKIVTLEDGSTELKRFNVKPMGTREQKWDWYDRRDEFLGKILTVKYQKKNSSSEDEDEEENDVPRFPIGKAIRDYE